MRSQSGKASRGFSLVETLITTLIMSSIMVIVVGGATVVQKLYWNAMTKADAQMVLSQIERTLRNDLSYTDECKIDPRQSDYDPDSELLLAGVVTQYHKNGFWFRLENGTETNSSPDKNLLYRSFSAAGESLRGEFENNQPQIFYEALSAFKNSRLERISVFVPKIIYLPEENCFHVSNLCIQSDGTTIAGSDSEGETYLIIRALNHVRLEDDDFYS